MEKRFERAEAMAGTEARRRGVQWLGNRGATTPRWTGCNYGKRCKMVGVKHFFVSESGKQEPPAGRKSEAHNNHGYGKGIKQRKDESYEPPQAMSKQPKRHIRKEPEPVQRKKRSQNPTRRLRRGADGTEEKRKD